jgi:ADP-ribosylglycohydrolase
MNERKNRFLGCLTGLAVGDAVGTTLEFRSPGTFKPINDMDGGGPFDLEPGEWTDDTSMALCLECRQSASRVMESHATSGSLTSQATILSATA